VEQLLVDLGAVPAVARALEAELRDRHREPHRRYHDLEHVAEVVAEVERLLPEEPEADRVAVTLAAWFHDAIYDPTAEHGASEEMSAELAVDRLPAFAATDRDRLAEEVARLVRLTVAHGTPESDRSGAVLVDADLWILSSPPERYQRYAREVREEYDHVPDDSWVAGRAAVVRRFLDQLPGLYGAGSLADREERRDRAALNLQWELDALDRPAAD
jgi:predicted metal-dependent HD superfamily phosphohydrolase